MGGDEIEYPEGWKENLTDEQTNKLKEMWGMLLKLKEDRSPIEGVQADKNADDDGGDEGGEGEDAMKGKAKDDAGKDKQAAAAEKKALAGVLGQYGAKAVHEQFWVTCRGEHPDDMMLRFLRARKWDVQRGFMMMCGSIKFQLEFGVNEIKEKGEEGMVKEDGFRMQYDIGKSYTHGTDNEGRPVIYIHVAKHHPKDQTQEALSRFVVFSMEASKTVLTPKSLGQGCLIFDLTNFGLSNMDWSCVKFILECFERYYPETLGKCLVHSAPMVFNAIWTVLRPLMDPVVRNKIAFTKNASDLAKFIPNEHLPKDIGGGEDWQWHYDGPVEGENKQMEDEETKKEKLKLYNDAWEEYEQLTQQWIDGDSGAKDKRDRQGKIIMIRHYDADPYLRGVTVMRREGIAMGDGRVKWTYEGQGEEVFGTSYNDVRKELGVEGECPVNEGKKGPGEAKQSKADRIDPDNEAAVAAGKTGGGMVPKLKRRASNSFSKVTPGPSDSEKARTEAQEQKDALEKEANEEREKAEAEEKQKKEEEEKQAEQQQSATGGLLGSITGAASGGAKYAAGFVPSAVGGEKVRSLVGAGEGANE